MKVLVTGGAGFIGSHITEILLDIGYEVIVIDNLVSGHARNLSPGVKFFREDIRHGIDEIFDAEKPDYVIHQAAQVSVARSILNPVYDGEENILSTIQMLNLSVRHNIKKFIFASTAAIYGNPEYLPIDESHPSQPISFYGLSKWNAELYIKLYAELHQLPYTILRYANVYGPRQDIHGEAGVIAIFTEKFVNGGAPVVYGDGLQTRDFVYVKDVARANVAALNKADNQIINVSTETETSILDIINQLSFTLNASPAGLNKEAAREGDIRSSILSNHKAASLLHWFPEYSFEKGIKETVSYYQQWHEHKGIVAH